MNRIEIKGAIVQNDMTYTPKGTAITELALGGQDNNKVFYQRVKLFGRIAEIYAEAPTGMPVLVEGRIQQDRWETKDGQKRSFINVIAQDVRALLHAGEMVETSSGDKLLADGRNRLVIAGNVVRNAQTNPKDTVAFAPVALNSKRKGEERTDFIDVKAFSDQETFETIRTLEKGQGLVVVGKLAIRSYDTDDGKRYASEVVADEASTTVKVGEATTAPAVASVEAEFPPEQDLPF